MALLPADARTRCATVCCGWRALAAADASLWARLDLSAESGVNCHISDSVLRGAAARAGGALETLDVGRALDYSLSHAVLLEVVRANAGTLHELHVGGWFGGWQDALLPLLRAAPRLHALSAPVECDETEALALLRNEPPFGPLRLQTLSVDCDEVDDTLVREIVAALPAHASLRGLKRCAAALERDDTCGALVDAVLEAQLCCV